MSKLLASIKTDRAKRRLVLAGPETPNPSLDQFMGLDANTLFEKIANQDEAQRAQTLKAVFSKINLAQAIKILVSTVQGINSIGANLVESPTVATAAAGDSGWKENRKKNFEGVVKSFDWDSLITFMLVASICLGLAWFAETQYPNVGYEDKNQGHPMDLIRSLKDFLTTNGDQILQHGKKLIESVKNLFAK